MNNQSRVFIICDISSLIAEAVPAIFKHLPDVGLREDSIDYFFDWAINTTLRDCYGMVVMGSYSHDIYKCLYDFVGEIFKRWFIRNIRSKEFEMLVGQDVKVQANGRDLFITRRVPYIEFFNNR